MTHRPWEDGLAALTAKPYAPNRKRVRVRITRGEHVDTVAILPDPRDAADHWLIPALRDRQGLRVVRDEDRGLWLLPLDGAREDARPLDVEALADKVRRLVAGLPERPGVDVYADLRRVCLDEPERARAYLRDVVLAARRGAGRLPAPRVADQRSEPKSNAEMCRASRERRKRLAEETSRAFLVDWLDLDEHGGTIGSADLWRMAQRAIAEWVAWADDDPADWREEAEAEGLPFVPVMPGRTTFLAVATEVLDRRRRGSGAVFLARAEEPEPDDTDALADLVERLAPFPASSTAEAV